ncbi:hypothetical protein HZS38_00090 [Xenorhabdus nematophila]|uniref:hypothetical protein n=1 Tax=Xenorhabdus nematophila TaxID=628 RepID=UPI000541997F|nr:hypothetical protein [Xenorhabdus nematophila]MBA0017709.1 hypothetical protein [Xenorhabdus nematophila]MCB4426675.1 hypothetical protein [Xenorhabdus nematophila]QNJ36772.1 hypothetical protein H8F46_00195 [Xenorhabdus nematophila]CEF33463.1 hypothetical protein XNW1_4780001 [Xenorhabdus nematophila str. Websteri]
MKKIGKKTSLRRVMKWLNFKFLYLIFGYKNARKRLELARRLRIIQNSSDLPERFAVKIMNDYQNDKKYGKK